MSAAAAQPDGAAAAASLTDNSTSSGGGVANARVLINRTGDEVMLSDDIGHLCMASHQILEESVESSRHAHFKAAMDAINTKYFALEISPDLTEEQRAAHMIDWWSSAHALLLAQNIERSRIRGVIRAAQRDAMFELRVGARELMHTLDRNHVPLLIFSAGLKETIKVALEEEGLDHTLMNNVHLIGNEMIFEQPAAKDGAAGAAATTTATAAHGAAAATSTPVSAISVVSPSAHSLPILSNALTAPTSSETAAALQHQPVHIHYANRAQFESTLAAMIALGPTRLQFIADFDRTLSAYRCTPISKRKQQPRDHDSASAIKPSECGKLLGFGDDIITSSNKNYTHVKLREPEYHARHTARRCLILIGDNIGDAAMAQGMDGIEHIIRIGLLHEKVDMRMPAFLKAFDVVLTNDADLSFAHDMVNRICRAPGAANDAASSSKQ